MQSALRIGLGMYGFEVITASHGIDALGQYKAHSGNFGTIVTDNEMPHMNGLELVRSLREIGFKGRIVVVSGNLKVEDLRAYQNYAISGFFHKPFEIGMLATILLQGEG
jgi:DNA-binding response OmpR family regulator